MTEAEWLTCTDPQAMKNLVWREAAFRKRCLFYAAACRQVWRLLPNKRCRRWVLVVEKFADDRLARDEFLDLVDVLKPACTVADQHEHAARVRLIQDIFGNPFRPVSIDPAWRTPTVTALTQAAYDDRILPAGHLDRDRLAVLADALEDAGCDSDDVLSHLRGPGPHVRGCWVLDLLLGKG